MEMNYKRVPKFWKYQLTSFYRIQTGINGYFHIKGLVDINGTGALLIRKGYAWDGPSGPAIDTANFMRGSLVHDALYQLMREGVLHQNDRKEVDQLLRDICIEDGMSRIRAWWVYRAVRMFGASSAKRK